MTEGRINQISKDCGNGVATRREMKVHKAVAAEARQEGINAHIRMKELEAAGHDIGAPNCPQCQEYRRLKEQG